MTPRSNLPPEELLSACHDGELTSAERAEVDRLLGDNAALKETLDDYRELTAVLQSLPRPQAPAKLQSEVLKRVQAARPQPKLAQSARRFPWLWGVSLAATAAVLVILVRGTFTAVEPATVATNSETVSDFGDVTAASAMVPGEVADARDESVAIARRGGALVGGAAAESNLADRSAVEIAASEPAVERPLMTAAPAAAAPVTDPSSRPDGAPRVAAGAAAPADGSVPAAEALASQLTLDPLAPPAATEVLSHVFQSGNQTMVVEFEVVNVDQTSQDMLVLLRQRGIVVMSAADESPAELPASHAQALTGQGGQPLVALYVQATDAQLAAVMEDMLSQVAIADGAAYNTALAGPDLGVQLDRFAELYGGGGSLAQSRMAKSSPTQRAASSDAPPPAAPQVVGSSRTFAADAAAGDPSGRGRSAGQGGVRLSIPTQAYRELENRHHLANQEAQATAGTTPAAAPSDAPMRPAEAAQELTAPKPAAQSSSESKAESDGIRQMLIVLKSPMRE